MVSGDVEVQGDIIAWPNPKGKYSERIQPAPDKGKYPLLIQGYVLEGSPHNYVLRGGKIEQLKTFPKNSGTLEEPIHELGLLRGAYVFSDSDPENEEGLRVVVRGDWRWDPDERRVGTDAGWGPSARDSRLASREVFENIDPVRAALIAELKLLLQKYE